ncbi:MAG: hypothetical protein ACKVOH_06015 [Chlamydiales bacterium]
MNKKPIFSLDSMEKKPEETHGRNGHTYSGVEESVMDEESLELTDEMDHEILMHRDAHFGGDFDVMLLYYNSGGVGVDPDFDIGRITYLKEVEEQLSNNLAALILTPEEMDRVAKARRSYEKLKEVYELGEEVARLPRMIADLILTEEEEPQELIASIVEEGNRVIPELLDIVNTLAAYDPLSPGYGFAPGLAIICLGKLRAKEAIVPIFERFGTDMVFEEEVLLEALQDLGESAKEFLLSIVKSRPITTDNIHAAFGLTCFPNDSSVATTAYEQLQDPDVRNKPLLSTYLLCACDALVGTPHKEAFIAMSKDPAISANMRLEIEAIVRDWK